jgi:RHH-type proline utilization regulon transcriptional repressor/proline dehydrogenase/delta 1-pyrroline-5-carboxylate dehydrogenase
VTARRINQALAAREGAIIPFIAETGGQNAMIVDSTALIERAVDDIVQSAFASAGQRCSALRVLFVQDDIADNLCELLAGAIQELQVGLPTSFATDVGPVIDFASKEKIDAHITHMHNVGRFIASAFINDIIKQQGTYVVPHAFEIPSIDYLKEEIFGPVLHVIRYRYNELDDVVSAINQTGYGLTFGVHSRIESRLDALSRSIHAGNHYLNRNMIGAVVGVQPFGGEGLSGTGPKAGGPHYLLRFSHERVRTVNTTAIGGNIELLSSK